MHGSLLLTRFLASFATVLLVMFVLASQGAAAEDTLSRTAGGLTVYLGVVPAEIVKGLHSGEPPMHGSVPSGAHEYHIMAAIFDEATSARVSNASVMARVSGLGLAGPTKALEPMQITGTTTYGGFFDLRGPDLYTVRLTIERPGAGQPVILEFTYDHRR